jgi:hypothetical protein
MLANLSSSFITYNLTPAQVAAGSTFTLDQRFVIQNLIASAAEEKIALTFDPSNPNSFIQREAELMGQIGILKYLLSLESSNLPEES